MTLTLCGAAWCPFNPHKPQFFTIKKRVISQFKRYTERFYACADYWLMRCNCMNCGLFLADENNMQKEVYLQNKSLESLLQEGEILEKFREEGGSHSSSVREVIPLSPSHPLPLFLPYSCKFFHRPTERGSVSTNTQKSSRVWDGARQHPKGQLQHPFHRIHSWVQ